MPTVLARAAMSKPLNRSSTARTAVARRAAAASRILVASSDPSPDKLHCGRLATVRTCIRCTR